MTTYPRMIKLFSALVTIFLTLLADTQSVQAETVQAPTAAAGTQLAYYYAPVWGRYVYTTGRPVYTVPVYTRDYYVDDWRSVCHRPVVRYKQRYIGKVYYVNRCGGI